MSEERTDTLRTESAEQGGEGKKPAKVPFFSDEHPFHRFLTLLFNLMLLNLLTLLCMLPVFTAGTALAALSAVLMEIAEGDDHEVTRAYFRSFKRSFSDATMLYLLYLPVVVIDLAYVALVSAGAMSANGTAGLLLLILSAAFLMSAVYGAALVARYENRTMGTFRNSWLLAFGYLPRTAVAAGAFVIAFILIAVTWPYLGSLALLFGISAPGYAAVRQVLAVFKEQEGRRRP